MSKKWMLALALVVVLLSTFLSFCAYYEGRVTTTTE